MISVVQMKQMQAKFEDSTKMIGEGRSKHYAKNQREVFNALGPLQNYASCTHKHMVLVHLKKMKSG